jgi:hypothetical protein
MTINNAFFMKRVLFILVALFIYCQSEAQSQKTFEAAKTQFVKIIGTLVFSGDSISDTTYHSTGRNTRFPQVHEYIWLHDGKLREIHAFFKYCGVFLKNGEAGASDVYLGNRLQIVKLKDANYVNVYGLDNDSKSFTTLGPNNIANIMSVIEHFAKTRHISLR